MTNVMTGRATADIVSRIGGRPPAGSLLRRKCACGGAAHEAGECEGCRKNKEQALHRRATGSSATPVPGIVHEVLDQPGRPLDAGARAFMESRFGHDLSRVRVYDGARAAESARAVNALAYTAGRGIVFGEGQYRPATLDGRRLLAHELAHAVAHADPAAGRPETVAPAGDRTESEADDLAERIMSRSGPVAARRAPSAVRRKLRVEKPGDAIPNPTGKGAVQTNADTIEQYLTTLSPEGHPKVDPKSGEVTMAEATCGGFLGSVAAGAKEGYRIGHAIGSIGDRVPVLGVLTGGIGAVIGGIVGAIGGLIPSTTPTGSSCICDMVGSKNLWRISVDDVGWPGTKFDDDAKAKGLAPGGSGGIVTAPSPNSPRLWGAGTASGKTLDIDPWLVLGHELCGHGWLGNSGSHGPDETSPRGEGGHQATVARENALRAEHGIELRGTFKQPNCGESYWRDRTNPAAVNWSNFRSVCESWRQTYNTAQGTSYKITDTIP